MNQNNKLLIVDGIKYALTKVLPGLMGFLAVIVLVKMVGAEEYGKYSILLSFILTLTAFCGGWLNQSLLRYYSRYSSEPALAQVLGTGLLLSIVSGLFLFILYGFLPITTQLEVVHIGFGLGLLAAVVLFQFQSTLFRAQLRPNMVIGITAVQSILALALPVFLIYKVSPKVNSILAGLAIAYAVPTVGKIFAALYKGKFVPLVTSERKGAVRSLLKKFFRFGWPLSCWFTASLALQFFDRMFIKYFYDFTQVGIYAGFFDLVVRIFSLLVFPLTLALHPRMMSLWNRAEQQGAIHLWQTAMQLQIAVFAGIMVCGAIFYENITIGLQWLFSELNPSYFHLLPPLAIGGFIWQFGLLIHKPLELNQQTHLMLAAMIIAVVVNLIGNIFFLPQYGLIATAYTYFVSGTVYILFTIMFSRTTFRLIFLKQQTGR